MVILDVAIVNVALHTVERGLDVREGALQWVVRASQQVGGALGLAVLSTVAAYKTDSVLDGLRRAPMPPDILDALTRGYSAVLLVGALFAIAGIVVAGALIRVDKWQIDDASMATRAA